MHKYLFNPSVGRFLAKSMPIRGVTNLPSVEIVKFSKPPPQQQYPCQLTTPTITRFAFKPCRVIETKSIRPPNYYELLGISRQATTSEIKAAYYHRAKQFHPDAKNSAINTKETKKFQAINEAYSVLSDDNKRIEFDSKSHYQRPGPVTRSARPQQALPNNFTDEIVLPITFVQSVKGVSRSVHFSLPIPCAKCKSVGQHKSVTVQVACVQCAGTGYQAYNRASYKMQMKCQYCRGARYTELSECPDCGGQGTCLSQRIVPVVIPAGTKDNEIVSVRNPNHPEQLLNVRVRIEPDGQFRRNENDVHSDVMVPFTVAILGGQQTVQDVYGGTSMILIPPGTVSDTKICLTGKGMRVAGSKEAGNHIVQIKIQIPSYVTERQRMMLSSFFSD